MSEPTEPRPRDRSPRDPDHRGVSRRGVLKGAAAGTVLAGLASVARPGSASAAGLPLRHRGLRWTTGDHHVHTVYSHDAKYLPRTQVEHAARHGLDWMVFTEHSNVAYRDRGMALLAGDLAALRREHRGMLLFQGLEWYIPAAEHCTVFTTPGRGALAVLREYQTRFDGKLNRWDKPAPGSPDAARAEAKAVEGLRWLAAQRVLRVDDILVLANHPSRLGIDSPHELRAWRDAAPGLMIGMEGAPGAQGSAFGTFRDPSYQRGEYENAPSAQSWPGYPLEAYRTLGGFDWMTAVVGGVWDSMLSEGRPFWITANSDHHLQCRDTTRVGDFPPGETFDTLGRRPDPVETGVPQNGSDYWPGEFARNHTAVACRSYSGVMAALRAGRSWVDHGHLLAGLDVELHTGRSRGLFRSATLGERLRVRAGTPLRLEITVRPTTYRNAAGIRPRLAHLDVIQGVLTGPARDRDAMTASATRVTRTFETGAGHDGRPLRFVHEFVAQESGYLRLRGSDGKRHGAGPQGAAVDPHGPLAHGGGPDEGDPWADTWCYANPIFVEVV